MKRSAQFACAFGVTVVVLLAAAHHAAAANPSTGDCLKANNSAVELRNDNKLQAARAQLLVCAAESCPADVRKECLRRIDEINAQIPTIIFEAKDGSGKDLGAVTVTMDGQPFADKLDGTALPVDPGEHNFTFEAQGQPTLKQQFVIREARKERRESITLGEAPSSPPREKRVEALPPPPPPPPDTGLGTQRVLAVVAGGLGLAGVGVGSVFGLQAMSKRNEAQSACSTNVCADQSGSDKWSDALKTARISDIAFVVGGAGLLGGVLLWVTAPSRSGEAPSAQVGLGLGSVQVIGVW
ncbi:MAG: hypothetical protein ABTD50_23035 [Polyangiaceae bacterium]|jgi:hypothetical protein